ncbi:hypothetical protein DUI87_13019 [Hirundo rustica rustica]|uniref:Uncharacterized protein n=1 Tax=Hirundo rustica rustica TaxID=333673 RepID=A0A3M0KAR8_HIRRU|nr:hypothetical protein DUI87_13019 [Hirundo rustica rustica]
MDALLLEVFVVGQGFEQSDLEKSLPMAEKLALEAPFKPKPVCDPSHKINDIPISVSNYISNLFIVEDNQVDRGNLLLDKTNSFLVSQIDLVMPHLEYCVPFWFSQLKKNADRLVNVQRRVTKMIQELENLTCEETLKDLDLMSIERADEECQHSIPGFKGQLEREGSLFTRSHAEETKAMSTSFTGRGFL